MNARKSFVASLALSSSSVSAPPSLLTRSTPPYKQMDSIIHLKNENGAKSEALLIPFRLPFFKSAAEAQKSEAISCRHVFTIIPEKWHFCGLAASSFLSFFHSFSLLASCHGVATENLPPLNARMRMKYKSIFRYIYLLTYYDLSL